MNSQLVQLRYAVRVRMVSKYLGQLMLVVTVLALAPLSVSLVSGDTAVTLRYGIACSCMGVLGALLARIPIRASLRKNEGIVVTTLAFLVAPLVIFCLSENDQANIIASLVARSLGFKRVVTSIENPEFEGICHELGLDKTIIPDRTISLHLEDMVRGFDPLELSTILKDKARLFTFTASRHDASSLAELNLPDHAKVICYYRNEEFFFADDNTRLREGDEVIILTHSKNLPNLKERWEPKQTNHDRGDTGQE